MGAGEHGGVLAVPGDLDLPNGAAVTASGRVSAAEVFVAPSRADYPFSPVQLARLDEALTMASRETGMRISVYLGDLGANPAGLIGAMHGELEDSAESVLVAVSPEQRVVEVVTGAATRGLLPDRGVKLAVMSMLASFKEDDLLGGLLSGLRMLADQAGGRHRAR